MCPPWPGSSPRAGQTDSASAGWTRSSFERMRSGAGKVQFDHPGVEIENRNVEAAVAKVDEPKCSGDSQVAIGHGRAAGIYQNSAVAKSPHHWDVGVTRYRDIDSAPKTAMECRGDILVVSVLDVGQIVGQADTEALHLCDVDVDDSRIFRDTRPADPRL